MSIGKFNLEGRDALYATFAELPRTTQRNVLLRTLKAQTAKLAPIVQRGAPVLYGDLAESLIEGEHRSLTRRQKRMEKRGAGKFEATVHFGTADPAGFLNEFGTSEMPAQPFFRQVWEAEKYNMLRGIEQDLGPQIVAAAERIARKNARKG